MKTLWSLLGLIALLVVSAGSYPGTLKLDPALPSYQPVAGVSGNLSLVGSDTLANVMTLWAEAFKRQYPGVKVQVQASGSSTAPPALVEGTANFGAMSRPMKRSEIRAFEQRYGYPPRVIPVAIDALAIYVHKDNPLQGISLRQLDGIFSTTGKCGAGTAIETWGDLGLDGSWWRRDIQLFGRNSVSGTYGYFKQRALCKGDFRNDVNEQPGSASVVQSVATSLGAIGYSAIGYRTASVRALPLGESGAYVEATPANIVSGAYPLSRYLYLSFNKAPGEPLPPLEREFLKMVLSHTGQEAILKDGYIPLPVEDVSEQWDALQL